jgi:hypothetical protein
MAGAGATVRADQKGRADPLGRAHQNASGLPLATVEDYITHSAKRKTQNAKVLGG